MTYVSCSTAIVSVEGAATLEVGDESVVEVEVANEVDDDDFFDEALLLTKDDVEVEEEVDFDFEVDKGVVRATDANLFGTLVLARVGTKIK
jgi:hypothetical protein